MTKKFGWLSKMTLRMRKPSACVSPTNFALSGVRCRKSADERENLGAHFCLARLSLGARVDGGNGGGAVCGIILRRDAVEILVELRAACVRRICGAAARSGSRVLRGHAGWRRGLCCGEAGARPRPGEKVRQNWLDSSLCLDTPSGQTIRVNRVIHGHEESLTIRLWHAALPSRYPVREMRRRTDRRLPVAV